MLQTYYDYINILAFYNVYRFENKKEIKLENLQEYRNKIVEEYNSDNETDYDNEEWNEPLNISFNSINEEQFLKLFLQNYSNYFYLTQDKIHLKNNISFTEIIMNLEFNLRNTYQICDKLVTISDNKNLRKCLDIKTIDNTLLEYSKIEKQLELTYTKLYTKNDNHNLRKHLKQLMDLKAHFYIRLGLLKNYNLEAFRICAIDNDYQDVFPEEYHEYPINKNLLNDDIENCLHSISQYSLFSKNVLYPAKIYSDIEFFQLESNMEEQIKEEINNDTLEFENEEDKELLTEHEWKIENIDCETEEKVFYLHYLNILNDFINTYGANEELIYSKTRLMYTLDNPKMRIYNDTNFQKEMEKLIDAQLEDGAWDYLNDEVITMINDLFFKESDKYTIRKLLLIKTYYLLTESEEVQQEIKLYQDDEKYDLFSSIIFNNTLRNKELEKGKQYFKKLNDLNI